MKFSGRVITGLGQGRLLGYPTANLECDPGTLEGGVYAAFVVFRDVRYPAALMIGGDFGANAKPKVEVHLLDQEIELVGEELTVDVGERVSEMKRVNSREELLQKIEADIQYVRKICG
ncbi:MAG: riboflavin kinase [Patescibacteria group bacterium]